MTRATIRVPRETRDHLAELAKERGMSISRLVEALAAEQSTAEERAERLAAAQEAVRRLGGVDIASLGVPDIH
ncbi:hypothetical protein ACFU99_12695 [Streptomyces sp. NPDC057654]|uniref:hypothetical protein n=1 Tax=Streptomyces sp. NPDC057654 TaxID=3346196 RepID=UPI0036ABBB89